MKRLIKLLTALLASVLLVTALPSCSGRPPKLEGALYDRLVEVIEASVDVNVVLFGAGLPTYAREGEEEDRIRRYYGVTDDGTEFVSVYARYTSIEQMKQAIAAVYSKSYAESLYETLFTGYATGTSSVILPARYHEDDNWLYQSRNVEPLVTGTRFFDYASMEVDKGSTSTYLRILIRSRADAPDAEWHMSHLSFIYEDGNWYLDGPSC